MNDDREVIFSRVRGALAPLARRAPYPAYADDAAVMHQLVDHKDPWTVFGERAKLVNGEACERVAEVVALLQANHWLHGYCDPKLWPRLAPAFGPEFTVETEFDRSRVDDYQFGITRAVGAIAETGRSSCLILPPPPASARWLRGCTSRRCGARRCWPTWRRRRRC